MEKNNYWGKITWTMLHTFPTVLTEEFYSKNSSIILEHIKNICLNVPCPYCSSHAKTHIAQYGFFNSNNNTTLAQLKRNIYNFHNHVNHSINKPFFNASIIDLYNDLDFIAILREWSKQYTIKGVNVNLNTQKQNVSKTRYKFIKFINSIAPYIKNNNSTLISLPDNDITRPSIVTQTSRNASSYIKKMKINTSNQIYKTHTPYKINFL